MDTGTRVQRMLRFQPSQLASVRDEVLERHPGTVDRPVGLDENRLAELRRRIEDCDGTAERLRQVAKKLTPREARACLTGLEAWDSLRPSTAVILDERRKPAWLKRLWQSWQRYPTATEIQALLGKWGDEYGWGLILSPGYAEKARDWVRSRRPGLQIVAWLEEQGLSYKDMDKLAETPFRRDTPLDRAVRDALMTDGSRLQLQAEGPARLGSWSRELSPDDRLLFHANYLVKIRSDQWNQALVEGIRDAYGLPRSAKRPAFWETVPEAIRDEFQSHFIGRKLKQVFSKDTRRHNYWRRWQDRMVDVRTGVAGQVEYAILDFSRFGVVEFFQTGNAAYFYDPATLKDIEKLRPSSPADLKIRIGAGRRDNRLLHQSRWELRADDLVQSWWSGRGRRR